MHVLISPSLLFSFKWRHSPNLDLALVPLKRTSSCTSSSYLHLTTSLLGRFFSLSLSNKRFMSVAQRLFFIFRFIPLLHLSIKPTKDGYRSLQGSPPFSSSMAAALLSVQTAQLCFFYSASSSCLTSFTHPLDLSIMTTLFHS